MTTLLLNHSFVPLLTSLHSPCLCDSFLKHELEGNLQSLRVSGSLRGYNFFTAATKTTTRLVPTCKQNPVCSSNNRSQHHFAL